MVETANTHCIRSVVMIVVLSVPISCVIDSQLDGQIPRDVLADWTTRQEQTSSIRMLGVVLAAVAIVLVWRNRHVTRHHDG